MSEEFRDFAWRILKVVIHDDAVVADRVSEPREDGVVLSKVPCKPDEINSVWISGMHCRADLCRPVAAAIVHQNDLQAFYI